MSNFRKPGEPQWQWPTAAQTAINPTINVREIQSPYGQNGTRSAICYPGTPMEPHVIDLAHELIGRQINALGTHTHTVRWNTVTGHHPMVKADSAILRRLNDMPSGCWPVNSVGHSKP